MINLKTVAFSLLSLLAVSPVVLSASAASAQPLRQAQLQPGDGMTGSYLGAGVSVGVGNPDDNDAILGGNVQGRLTGRNLPLSLRGSVLFNDQNVALIPTVTYDVGIAPNTNLYVGGGYSFTTNDRHASPLGDQDAPVVTAGVETAVRPNLVLYGDTKVGINAYKNDNTAVSFQVGAGYRF
jgi:opacity protein-like surface antigen